MNFKNAVMRSLAIIFCAASLALLPACGNSDADDGDVAEFLETYCQDSLAKACQNAKFPQIDATRTLGQAFNDSKLYRAYRWETVEENGKKFVKVRTVERIFLRESDDIEELLFWEFERYCRSETSFLFSATDKKGKEFKLVAEIDSRFSNAEALERVKYCAKEMEKAGYKAKTIKKARKKYVQWLESKRGGSVSTRIPNTDLGRKAILSRIYKGEFENNSPSDEIIKFEVYSDSR